MSVFYGIDMHATGRKGLMEMKGIHGGDIYRNDVKVDFSVNVNPLGIPKAVEAGESLGFLPGDLKEKVDPYLRPIYDSLYAILGVEPTNRLMERGVIEVAPLAYMRGRNPNDSPASTAGLVKIIRDTSPFLKAAIAITTARKVFPVPAGPIPKTTSYF